MNAASEQLSWTLLLAASWAVARKGKSRDRHFAMLVLSTVVNAANAVNILLLRVCGTAWLCALHMAMRGPLRPPAGGHSLLGMQLGTWARVASAEAARAAACALLAFLVVSTDTYPVHLLSSQFRASPICALCLSLACCAPLVATLWFSVTFRFVCSCISVFD